MPSFRYVRGGWKERPRASVTKLAFAYFVVLIGTIVQFIISMAIVTVLLLVLVPWTALRRIKKALQRLFNWALKVAREESEARERIAQARMDAKVDALRFSLNRNEDRIKKPEIKIVRMDTDQNESPQHATDRDPDPPDAS